MFAWRRTAVRKRVLVNLTTDKAFRGVLWRKRGGLLILKGAELVEESGQRYPLDGEVLIERSKVEFIQILPAEA